MDGTSCIFTMHIVMNNTVYENTDGKLSDPLPEIAMNKYEYTL